MDSVHKIIQSIKPVDSSLAKQVITRLNSLTKPVGSLGRLEEIVLQYCLIKETASPVLAKKRIVVFAADHGVVKEGISAYPRDVTPQMVTNILNGGAAVNVLANQAGADVQLIDIGVNYQFDETAGLYNRKIKYGTDNIAAGPAMSYNEVIQAIEVGIEMAQIAENDNVSIIGTGEMGIGNTTPSSALFATLLPCEVKAITGTGTGINEYGLQKKIYVIKKALKVNEMRLTNPLETLAAIGGLEIAGICGLILGAVMYRIPVVVDGFISSAAALVACRLNEHVKDYLFWSHCSAEKGHQLLFDKIRQRPILDLKMRLGEGTGAALALPVIESSIRLYKEMATFESAGVSSGKQ